MLCPLGGVWNMALWRMQGRYHMKKYFKENPPISEDMIVAMMSQMGQKPSNKKVHQVMNMMKHQQR